MPNRPRQIRISFNTQPPEGGWPDPDGKDKPKKDVSTHSRLKAAGFQIFAFYLKEEVSTHSRLKAAGFFFILLQLFTMFQHTAA